MTRIIKQNSEVEFNQVDLLTIDSVWLDRIKHLAKENESNKFRTCIHFSDEDHVHEMLIAHTSKTYVRPHKHRINGESLQIIEGRLLLVIFDMDGNIVRQEEMAPSGNNGASIYRLNSTPWHTMIPLTDMVVVHETLQGPFESSSEPLPNWIPPDNNSMKKFIQELLVSAGLV